MKNLSVMFDLDGVLADFAVPFVEWVRAEFDVSAPTPSWTVYDFFVEWGWGRDKSMLALEAFTDVGGWLELPTFDAGVAAVHHLLEDTVHVHFVTARPKLSSDQTTRWLAAQFGASGWSLSLEPSPKVGGARFAAGFDDCPANVRSLTGSGCRSMVLVDRTWNRDVGSLLLPRVGEAEMLAAARRALMSAAA